VGAIGGIYVDQRRAGTGRPHVHHDPLVAVGGPDADTVAATNAQSPESAGDTVGLRAQLSPGKSLALMARSHRQTVGKAFGSARKQVADGEVEERAAGASRVAQGAKVFFYWHRSFSVQRRAVYTLPGGRIQCGEHVGTGNRDQRSGIRGRLRGSRDRE